MSLDSVPWGVRGMKCAPLLGHARKNRQYTIPHSHSLFPAHAFPCGVLENEGSTGCKAPRSWIISLRTATQQYHATRVTSTRARW